MLSEQRRKQLDGIVFQMQENKENDGNIQTVVNDFIGKYGNEAPASLPKPEASPVNMNPLKTFADLNQGFLKQAAKKAITIGELGAKGINKITGGSNEHGISKAANTLRGKVETKGAAEKVGAFAEDMVELAAPVGKVGLVAKAGKLKIPATALSEAVKFGGQKYLETKDVEEAKTAAIGGAAFGTIAPTIDAVIQKGFPAVASWLEKTNLRLTPTQKSNMKGQINDAVDYLRKNASEFIGSPEQRYEKIKAVYEGTEKKLQGFLGTNNTAKNIFVSKSSLVSDLEKLKGKAMRDSADAPAIARQVEQAIQNIKDQYRFDKIPISRLNLLKRSTYENAYNKAGEKVLDWVEHDIARVYRKSIEKSTKGLTLEGKPIDEFNREYGQIINTKKLLKTAMGRKQLGLIGNMMAAYAGSKVGDSLGGGSTALTVGGAVAAPMAGGFAGTLARSLVSAGLTKATGMRPEAIERTITKLITEIINNQDE